MTQTSQTVGSGPQKKRAVILFADILGSTEFASTQTPEKYSEMVRAFHRMACEVIQAYERAEKLSAGRLHYGGVGDECHVFLVGGGPNEDERHAMRLAVRLKQGWMNSDFGKDLAAFAQNPYGTKVDLRVGIGCGDVVFDQDVWTGEVTPEGIFISQAKRIESLAEQYAEKTYILVKLDIKEAAERAGLEIEFGDRVYPQAKGFDRGNTEVAVYPVLSWKEFVEVQEQVAPQPQSALDFARFALALQRSGDLDGAIANYMRSVELDPRFHEAWYNMGNAYRAKGEHDRAIECYEKALAIKPDSHGSWNNMGVAYSARGEHDRAIECYEKALAIKPDSHESWNNMGNAYRHKGDHNRAIECYEKALAIKPENHESWNNMGNAYSAKGEHDRAIECYEKALTIKPDNDEAWYNMGNACSDKGEHDRAIECYEKALAIKPDKDESWNNMGNAYSAKGEHDRAIECYEKALAIKPERLESWNNMGNAYKHKGEHDRAIECYEKALAIKPDSPEASYNLACAFSLKGQVPEAVEHLTRAVALNESYKENARSHSDFDPIRNDPEFCKLVYDYSQ